MAGAVWKGSSYYTAQTTQAIVENELLERTGGVGPEPCGSGCLRDSQERDRNIG